MMELYLHSCLSSWNGVKLTKQKITLTSLSRLNEVLFVLCADSYSSVCDWPTVHFIFLVASPSQRQNLK
jgi:hypothetical protein